MTEDRPLEYIQINHKNKIEELSFESHVNGAGNLLNLLRFCEEDIGGDINKFFLNILPENKEADPFKVISSIANKSKYTKNQVIDCINYIMNKDETTTFILTKELGEKLAIVIKEIFKKIKKSKVKNFEDLQKKLKNSSDFGNRDDFLKRYANAPSLSNSNSNLQNSLIDSKSDNTLPSLQLKPIKSADTIENKIMYQFKELKEDKKNILPTEMLILIHKYNKVTKLKLTINNDYNSSPEESIDRNSINNAKSFLDQNDLQNNILVLLNLEWLFPNLVELEVDLSNKNIIESEILLYNYSLTCFSQLIHKDIKITTYQNNPLSKRKNNLFEKTSFSQMNEKNQATDKFSKFSASMNNNNLNYSLYSNSQNINENNNADSSEVIHYKHIEQFIEKYKVLLEMIIVYSYFIRQMSKVTKTHFKIPLNLGNEILEMLRRQKIYLDDFHFLSLLTNKGIQNSTIEFNSLDNQSFEKILSFLDNQDNISCCNLSFFPQEEYFKTELLFKILQNCNDNYKLNKNNAFNPIIVQDIKGNEDLDIYILRKLSESFERNLYKFFCFLTLKTCITELGLVFNLPTILNKNGYFNNILMKFFLDLFIIIDTISKSINSLTLRAENFIFDSRKNPILNDFCDKLHFYLNKKHKLKCLIFQVRFYRIQKIYRFIPYNLEYLSIGSLDYETFNCLVDYLTSSEYSMRTQLTKLTIKLNNSVLDISKDKIYENIVRLLTEYPKKLTEINLCTFLIISFHHLYNLLIKTNYNTLPNIFMQFSSKSYSKDKELEKYLEKNVSLKGEKIMKLYTIIRKDDISNKLVNLMMHLGLKNKDIMQYNIYSNIEKFLCQKEKKKVLIQFK